MRDYILIIAIAIGYYCYTSPFFKKLNPVSYSVNLPEKFDGPLTVNHALDKAERLHENTLYWPESFAAYKNELYTGLGDGRVVRLAHNKVVDVFRTGKGSCEGKHEEHLCGRPLGMAFNKAGQLYVADAYLGLVTFDLKTKKKVIALPSDTVVDGLPLTFLNSLVFDDKEEVLYITQSSTRWNISTVIVSLLEHDSSGRVLKYDLKTKKISPVLSNLVFPNGIELSTDGSTLLIAELGENKIIKYYIKGSKAGTKEDLVVLPGGPDNIKRNKQGNYWTSISQAETKETLSILHRFSDYPWATKIVLNAYRIFTSPICMALRLNPEWKELSYEIENMRLMADYVVSHGLILEFNDKGQILRSLHSPTGNTKHLSEAFEHNGYLYLGSWRNNFVGRLKL